MGISAMWNAISLVQDLNSCRRVHFLRREKLTRSEMIMNKLKTPDSVFFMTDHQVSEYSRYLTRENSSVKY